MRQHRAVQPLPKYRLEHRQPLLAHFLLSVHGALEGNDFRTLLGEVSVAQPAVVLAARVDDPAYWLWRYLADGGLDELRARRDESGHWECRIGLD